MTSDDARIKNFLLNELRNLCTSILEKFFCNNVQITVKPDNFPFTEPSLQFLVSNMGQDKNDIREVIGCGVLKKEILLNSNISNKVALAAGFGIDRLAMELYNINDIRYFWSDINYIQKQFKNVSNEWENVTCKVIHLDVIFLTLQLLL